MVSFFFFCFFCFLVFIFQQFLKLFFLLSPFFLYLHSSSSLGDYGRLLFVSFVFPFHFSTVLIPFFFLFLDLYSSGPGSLGDYGKFISFFFVSFVSLFHFLAILTLFFLLPLFFHSFFLDFRSSGSYFLG